MTFTPDPDLIAALGHDFREPSLLERALTHPSAIASSPHTFGYERLEFLGDRVLGLVIAEFLWRRYPEEAEGSMSRRLVAMVRTETLALVGQQIGLGAHLILANGEDLSGGRESISNLANSMEAVIAAIYLDAGLEAATAFIDRYWSPLMEGHIKPPREPKTALQEWAQARGIERPRYRIVERKGPPHRPVFTVEALVAGLPPARGEATSKRAAERLAAAELLEHAEGLGND